ncbi:AraC family transcriptional regulator [Nonomuraea sp. NPDC050310]|uniref:AraC family transcriptional regulator n=1 Tax=unclassified Nonomuraea TaxID=2593643 RepID=UPI0033E2663F
MDALAGLLSGPRAQGAFLVRALLDPPWSILVQDEAPLSVVVMLRGDAWVLPDVRLRQGDVVITRGPEPLTFCDDPSSPVQIVIDPGQHCRTLDGRELVQEMSLGLRTWGTSPDGATAMLIGSYQLDSEVSKRLLRALPPLVVMPAVDSPLVALLDHEIGKDDPGQEVVLDRLLDLLVIAVLRGWFASRDTHWYLAFGDPVVGRALRLMHNDPAHPWTVAALAERVGVSRATFARTFTDLVGEPPMSYLTDWRLTLAADLLREPGATIGTVARKVGYGSPFALSAAFKRVRGVSPQEHRAGR